MNILLIIVPTDKAPNVKNNIAEELKLDHNQKLLDGVILESIR